MTNAVMALYSILKEYSDESHILTRKQIEDLLDLKYQIKVTRQTLSTYMKTLDEFGVDICDYHENGIGYYLREREFETSEIHLLCNAVYSSHFIPEKNSQNLIEKLLKTQSKFTANQFHQNVYVKNLRKSINKEFFLNIDILLEAIHKQKAVSFNYMKYDIHKHLIPRKDHPDIVHPYHIIYANENFYLICKNDHYDNLSHYRIDKMQQLRITDKKLLKLRDNFDPYEYARTKIYMYGGKEERILLKCNVEILDDIIDKFGHDVTIQGCDDTHFFAYVKASTQGIVYLILQYLKYRTVIEPLSLRTEIKKILKDAQQRYAS